MPTPIRSPELVPGLQQSLCKQRVKIFLEIAFISNQPPELAGFPSLFDWIKCCIVKEALDVPMWVTQPVDRSRIPMEELRIQQLARSTILVQASLPDLALHLGFHGAHRFIHSRSCDILNHLIACDRQIYADRFWESEHEPIANLAGC
jgi:hypothetical protein